VISTHLMSGLDDDLTICLPRLADKQRAGGTFPWEIGEPGKGATKLVFMSEFPSRMSDCALFAKRSFFLAKTGKRHAYVRPASRISLQPRLYRSVRSVRKRRILGQRMQDRPMPTESGHGAEIPESNFSGYPLPRTYLWLIGIFGVALSNGAHRSITMEKMMRQAMTILATALLATSLVTAQAQARGGGGGFGGGGGHAGGMGAGFGGGVHIGGVGGVGAVGSPGGAHTGGIGAGERLGTGLDAGGIVGRVDGGRIGVGDHGHMDGLHHHAMHRFDRIHPGYGYDLNCYNWSLLRPHDTSPPYCG
jgi:hypothetical protein